MMKKIKLIIPILTFFAIFMSCEDFSTDLEVLNVENPDDYVLTSDPVALVATGEGILQNWYLTVHNTAAPGAVMATMADVSTCSWGNWGMRDLSNEPRVAFNNTSSYGNDVSRTYFNSLYAVLTDSNTLALAIANGTEFDDPASVEMIAKFGQALSIGYLALVFDSVWLFDETGPITDGTGRFDNSSTYSEAMAFALGKLDEAIALAETNNLSLSEVALPGGGGANTTLLQFMNSMGARMLVGNLRSSAEKATADWDKVLDYANAGMTADFEIYMDDSSWYDLIPKTYLVYPGWGRTDMRVINKMDPTQPAYWEDGVTNIEASTSPIDDRLNTDYEYLSSNSFAAARGYYHYSNYRYSGLDDYITIWTINVVELSKSENDMYIAEALVNKSAPDLAAAAAVINAGTRVTRGKLPEVAADADAIAEAIHHERIVEFAYTGTGLSFFEMRKEDLLQSGTLLHFPIPGTAIESIPAEYYTFGGAEGEGGKDYSTGGWR